ncbi:carboxypeptidase-like regulatory domain-containing protein [Hyalangium rubrum]|uniref:Carboxypeptidase-like regulatory domain-containing protein n=1 Tax=Hyalangium rubrum TaxID=3103134 RepID=A0ABU5GXT2_9BACT|nr:carboxypeptidase-like regulatory domain-containing protein [Hyalangium sp. s54d21]MDY7225995.1 carboxypeptidase-like regulatory domain-containing protein [Hyalangium sp. s54d21]
MKKLVMAAVVPLLAFGCGDDPVDANGDGIADGVQTPDNVSVVVPAKPKGTVSGQVLTTQHKPLAGANVSMTIGSDLATKVAQTDAEGNFAFKDIPGGAQVLLTFAKDGYAPLRAVGRVPVEAGNIPINDGNASFGPVVLSESNGTVKFTLISPTGRPAEGVRATLQVESAGTVLFGPTDSTSSTVVAEATADNQGIVTFNNVPPPAEIDRITTSAVYKLIVYAHDANGDGILESNGRTVSYSGSGLLTGANAKPLSLAFTYDPVEALAVEHSNLAVLRGGSTVPQYNMLKTGESVYIVFNQPVQTNSVVVGLTDEYGKESLPINKAVTNGGTVLTLSPQSVLPGKEYNLYYRAVSLNGDSFSSDTISFFGGDVASPQPISVESVRFQEANNTNNGTIDSSVTAGGGEDVYVNFNQVMKARVGTQFAVVYFHADLNNSNTIGDAVGERNPLTGKTLSPNSGFPLVSAEPLAPIATRTPAERPVFNFAASGYTTRFRFRYTGNYSNGTTTVPYTSLNPTSNFPMFIAFAALDPTVDAYESGWGVSQTADITVNGSTITPIAVPVATP